MTQERRPRGQIRLTIESTDPLLQRDLERHSNARRIVIVSMMGDVPLAKDIATRTEDSSSRVIFDLNNELRSEDLAMVQGYESHGVFSLVSNMLKPEEPQADQFSPLHISVEAMSNEHERPATSTLDVDLASLVVNAFPPNYRLAPISAESNGISVTISTITIFTGCMVANQGNVDNIVESYELWKWAKPSSVYPCKMGRWEVTLLAAIRDGIIRAGSELMILRRRAGLDEKQAIFSGKLLL